MIVFYDESNASWRLIPQPRPFLRAWRALLCVTGADEASHCRRRAVFLTLEWRLMLLDRCCCCCCSCGQPLHPCAPPPPPTQRNGFFQANLSLSPRRWRQPKCESGGGGEGRLHPLPAIAVRRRLLLWNHTRRTRPSPFSVRPSQERREDRCFGEGEWASWLFRVAAAAGAPWMCVPLRVQPSDNGASWGNFSYLSASKLYLRVTLSS